MYAIRSYYVSINKSVYFENNKPRIKKPKTKTSIRSIPLLEPLEALLKPLQYKGYIFTYEDKMLCDKRAKVEWKHYCEETEINITIHQLRHAYATRLYELNIDEKSAQDRNNFV